MIERVVESIALPLRAASAFELQRGSSPDFHALFLRTTGLAKCVSMLALFSVPAS